MLEIEPLPLLADNYAWLLSAGGEAAVVDPGEGPPVLQAVRARGLTLKSVLATHHHGDHVGGIPEIVAALGDVEVFCSVHDRDRVPAANHAVVDGETFSLLGAEVHCLLVPGHTLGAVAYHVPAAAAVFTGDTLFLAGCGRLFEGTAADMHESLHRLASLPPQTRVFCGHEYTEKNLRFAASVEPARSATRERLEEVQKLRQRGVPSVPALLATELATNPFLRVGEPGLQVHLSAADSLSAFAELRHRRDVF